MEFKLCKEKIKRILKFVLNSPHCNFYRKKYQKIKPLPEKINSSEEFQKLPFLTKKELTALSWKKRCYVPLSNINYLSISDATTDEPLIFPHSYKPSYYSEIFDEEIFKESGVKKFLLLLPPTSSIFLKIIKWPPLNIVPIVGDDQNLDLSASLAKRIEVEGIITTPSLLFTFIPYLKNSNFDFEKTKWILLLSKDRCTRQKIEHFNLTFPQAKTSIRYESPAGDDVLGYRCPYLENKKPWLFHPHPNIFLEVINKEGSVLKENEIGEIVYTHLVRKAFPLIRYKTQDIGQLTKKACTCGNPYLLQLFESNYTNEIQQN